MTIPFSRSSALNLDMSSFLGAVMPDTLSPESISSLSLLAAWVVALRTGKTAVRSGRAEEEASPSPSAGAGEGVGEVER